MQIHCEYTFGIHTEFLIVCFSLLQTLLSAERPEMQMSAEKSLFHWI